MSRIFNNPKLKNFSKNMRNNPTYEESKLWNSFLKTLKPHFHRQKPIGKYIVDFYCPKAKLVLELDGSQHFEDKNIIYDTERDNYLRSLGISVVRYSNLDVKQHFESICEDILLRLNATLKKP